MKRISLALACLGLVAAGCGSTSSSSGGSGGPCPSQAPASSVGPTTINMQNISFSPKSDTVKVGQKITWVNKDNVDHNVTTTCGAAKFASKDFGQGGSYSFTPTKPGTIEYTCTLHPGMDATLVVTK